MLNRNYPHHSTGAYNLRPGHPVKASIKITGSNEWIEIEGIVRKAVKTGATRVRLTVEDRQTGKLTRHSLDYRHPVRVHKGYLSEHGLTLTDGTNRRQAFCDAPKGWTF